MFADQQINTRSGWMSNIRTHDPWLFSFVDKIANYRRILFQKTISEFTYKEVILFKIGF